MGNRLCIYICNSLLPELSHLLSSDNFPDVTLKSFPSSCVGHWLTDDKLNEMLTDEIDHFSKIIVFASSCRGSYTKKQSSNKKIEIVHLEQCFEILFNLPAIYHFIKQGNYIVTNGWLRNYKHHIKEWGFDEKSAKLFFGESIQKILLLETGLPGNYLPNLEALSEYMGLSFDILPIGNMHLQKNIESLIYNWRNENERIESNERIAKITRESADYSVIFSQLKKLIDLTDETQIEKEISNLLDILFMPKEICFQKYIDGKKTDYICYKKSIDTELLNNENTFTIDIEHRNELLGVFKVAGIQFPNFIHQYKTMKLVIGQIGGLSIENARKYSELEIAKLAISDSEARFKAIMKQSPSVIEMYDLDGLLCNVNHAFEELWGYSANDTVNKFNILESEEAKGTGLIKYILQAFNGETVQVPEYSINTISKADFKSHNKWLSTRIYPIKDTNEKVQYIIISHDDITDRRQADEKIRKLSQAVEQSPVSVVITNLDGNIEYVNPKFESITGYTSEEVQGKNPRVLKSGNHSDDYYKLLWENITNGKIWRGEFQNKKKNGDFYWESASISPIKNHEGNITHFIAVKEDITDRKLAEEEIQLKNEELQLLNATKDKFFSIIAHDLKSPFNSIIGFSEALVEQVKNADYKGVIKYADIINQSSYRAMNLLMNLMEWAQSQTGRLEFNPEFFTINDIINENSSLFAEIASQKSITIKSELPDKYTVFADKAMINTILRNLISNAVKFTKQGGDIYVSATLSQNKVIVSVRDTGVGIPPESIEKLFSIDESYSTYGTNKESGTGLGLILCKEFIDKHAGKIWVESELAIGTCFYFTLSSNTKNEEKTLLQNEFSTVKSHIQFKDLKILIADDDETSEILLSINMKGFCREILKAKTALKTVEICRNNPDIDLILMDIQMPGMTGYEACRQIREFNKEVIIIAQTAYGLSGDREKAIQAGCNDYISKPIKKEEMYKLINKYF